MSDCTPGEEEFIDTYVSAMSGGCTPIEDHERTAEARRGIAKVKADALREAAAGFIDWDALRGYAQVTPEIEESHKSADYLMREADRIESGASNE